MREEALAIAFLVIQTCFREQSHTVTLQYREVFWPSILTKYAFVHCEPGKLLILGKPCLL